MEEALLWSSIIYLKTCKNRTSCLRFYPCSFVNHGRSQPISQKRLKLKHHAQGPNFILGHCPFFGPIQLPLKSFSTLWHHLYPHPSFPSLLWRVYKSLHLNCYWAPTFLWCPMHVITLYTFLLLIGLLSVHFLDSNIKSQQEREGSLAPTLPCLDSSLLTHFLH